MSGGARRVSEARGRRRWLESSIESTLSLFRGRRPGPPRRRLRIGGWRRAVRPGGRRDGHLPVRRLDGEPAGQGRDTGGGPPGGEVLRRRPGGPGGGQAPP